MTKHMTMVSSNINYMAQIQIHLLIEIIIILILEIGSHLRLMWVTIRVETLTT